MNDATTAPKVKKTKRDPQRTREAILKVAGKLVAEGGLEALSVSQVAQLAGVNRGTAYHHFPTREELLSATKAWVSNKLCTEVFGNLPVYTERSSKHNTRDIIDNLANFAMENPESCRVWLYDVLSSPEPDKDPFWRLYRSYIESFVGSESAQPDIDAEVHAVLMLVGVFLWPVWARTHNDTPAGRRKMAKRLADEVIRFILNGALRKEKFPELYASIKSAPAEMQSDS
ncbi:MAG TPA: TetR/AcrR family transcriptional regulator [Spongiibacteraceae bacterium]|nr:TetR/AcrR family transcriptional regulator [Spongiibacteraceae bacterium]